MEAARSLWPEKSIYISPRHTHTQVHKEISKMMLKAALFVLRTRLIHKSNILKMLRHLSKHRSQPALAEDGLSFS